MTAYTTHAPGRRFPRALIALAVIAYCAVAWAAVIKVVDVGVDVAFRGSDSRFAERFNLNQND